MALYAGRSVGSVDKVMAAAEVVEELSGSIRLILRSVGRNAEPSYADVVGAK